MLLPCIFAVKKACELASFVKLLPTPSCFRRISQSQARNLHTLQILCFYFVFTVFSTVGFGDIFAVNTAERVRLPNMDGLGLDRPVHILPRGSFAGRIIFSQPSIISSTRKFHRCFVGLQVFCIVLFLAGSSIFGTLLSQVCVLGRSSS